MQMLVLFLMIHKVIPVTFGYGVRCPVSAEWRFRARKLNCSSSEYVCLFHSHKKAYYETCDGLDYSNTGSKLIFEPFFNKAECSYKRYQPFPFSTDGSSNCVYQKSACNEDGQYVFHIGISKNDTTCGCNFLKGYTFITKPRHKCYCMPSEEDCSCYKHACNFKENKCSHVDAANLNNSCPEIITIPSHEKEMTKPVTYDENHENKGRQSQIQLICLTTILLVIISIVYVADVNKDIKTFNDLETERCFDSIGDVVEMKGMDSSDKDHYMKAITLGKEVRRYVRIIVIGEHGAGKSTLVRRLLEQDVDGINSTDGIEMNNKFQIRESNGQWVFNKAETDIENITKRIRQTVDRNPKNTLPKTTDSIEEDNNCFKNSERSQNPHRNPEKTLPVLPDSIEELVNPSERNSNVQEPITSKQPYEKSEQKETNPPLIMKGVITTEKIDKENPIVTDQTYEEIQNKDFKKSDEKKSDQMLHYHVPPWTDETLNITDKAKESYGDIDEILLQAKNANTKMISEGLIQCGIWDFAGEKDYYVTHQTFLTPHAIYLIVADVNKDIKTFNDLETERCFDSIGGYIDFWFDSIHCFCEGYSTDKSKKLNPPILMVLTHTDKCDEVETRINKYDDDFTKVIGSQPKGYHNRGIHFVSNTDNFQKDILKLQEQIVDIAREMKYFAEELPTEWISLEYALAIIRNGNENTVSWERMKKIASRNSFTEIKQLIEFLTYQTKIGNIIFFKDVRDYIILKPEWLVKCFRCLVFNDSPMKTNKNILQTPEWFMLTTTGELTSSIIKTLFEKESILESQKQDFLLKVMEKFDVIVKPKVKDHISGTIHESNLYFIPCMIKTEPTSLRLIENKFIVKNNPKFIKSSWLIAEFVFLPLAYFNHILFYYIRNYTVYTCPTDESKAIYRGKAVFYIDEKKEFSKLIVCFSKNALSLQIWKWEDVGDETYRTILEDLCNLIKQLNRKLRHNLSFVIKAKCPEGDYSNSSDRISVDDLVKLGDEETYMCKEHTERHRKDEIQNTWLKHVKSALDKYEKDDGDKNEHYAEDEDALDKYEKDDGDKNENYAEDEDTIARRIASTIDELQKTLSKLDKQRGLSICSIVKSKGYRDKAVLNLLVAVYNILKNDKTDEINFIDGVKLIQTISETLNTIQGEVTDCIQIPAIVLQWLWPFRVMKLEKYYRLSDDMNSEIITIRAQFETLDKRLTEKEDYAHTLVNNITCFVENVQRKLSILIESKDICTDDEANRVQYKSNAFIKLYMNLQFLRSAYCIRYFSDCEPCTVDKHHMMLTQLRYIEETQANFLKQFAQPTRDNAAFFALFHPSEHDCFTDYMQVKGMYLQDLYYVLNNNKFAIRPQKWLQHRAVMSNTPTRTIWSTKKPDKYNSLFEFISLSKVDNTFLIRSVQWPSWYMYMKDDGTLRGHNQKTGPKREWKIVRLDNGKYMMCTRKWPSKFIYMHDGPLGKFVAAYGDPGTEGYMDLIHENEINL